MPASTALGFPYPLPGEAPDGPGAISALAAALNTYLTALRQARQVVRASVMTVPDNTDTSPGAFDSTTYNVGGIAYAAGEFTVSVGGLYEWDATVGFQAITGTGFKMEVGILVNSSAPTHNEGEQNEIKSLNETAIVSAGGSIALTAGDVVKLRILQNSGSSMTDVHPYAFALNRKA